MSGFVINSVTISGNLTRDPELRSLPSGTSVCGLRIASNERYKDQGTGEWSDRPGYYDITIWKGMGEWVSRSLAQGDQIVVEGRLRWREWETPEGQKRQAIDIVANSIVPVPRDGGGGSSRRSESDVPIDTGDLPVGVGVGQSAQSTFTPSAADDDIPF